MPSLRILLYFVRAAALGLPLCVSAQSQGGLAANAAFNAWSPPGGQGQLGLSLGKSRVSLPCTGIAFLCDDRDRATQLAAGPRVGGFWGLEMSHLNLGNVAHAAGAATQAQGLNLSLVGKAPLGQSLKLYGRVGTTWGRADTSANAGAFALRSEQGFGFSYGAGLSYDITPRLSATLEWDSNDFRFGGGRDPVRSTSLGLQFRY
jgi:OmpA-OmpF porin, OOP family